MITTGIGDMAVYIPKLLMRLSRLLERYALSNPTIQRILDRAIERTGQISMRFPNFWEDAVTMAAQAAMQLLSRMNHSAIASLRYIAVGTESATDMAKPIAAHVGGMLRAAGFPIPDAIATFQTQHACAGGTYSLMGVNALLSLGSVAEERGLVICTDVARYDTGTSAEITQGAGAVAMIAERSCGLAELDLATAGLCLARRRRLLSPGGRRYTAGARRVLCALLQGDDRTRLSGPLQARGVHPGRGTGADQPVRVPRALPASFRWR